MGGGQGQWEEDQQGGGKKPGEKVKEELRSGEIQGKWQRGWSKTPVPIIMINKEDSPMTYDSI